jgi:DNA-binding transcriptional LysR family regulator
MCVVAGRRHPLAGRKGLKLADLAAESWILPTPETAYRARIDAAFRQEGVEPPKELVESVSILTNTMLLQETAMLGVLPYNVARHYVAAGSVAVLDVALPPPSGPVGLITRVGPLSNPALDPLLDAVRTVAARMAR